MASTPSALIPQPPEVVRLTRITDLWRYYLKGIYPDLARFTVFTKKARLAAKAMCLSKDLESEQMDHHLFQAYVAKVCDSQPHRRLLDYDRCWPLRVVVNLRAKNYLRNQSYKAKEPHERSSKPSATASYAPHKATRLLTSSPSRPNRRSPRTPAQAAPTKTPPVSCSEHLVPHGRQTPSAKPYVLIPPRRPHEIGRVQTQDQFGRITQQQPSTTSTNGGSCSTNPFVVHAGCLDCGHGPGVAGPKTELFSIIGENPDHVLTLVDAGLVDDAHLRIFWQWPLGHRARFVKGLSTTPFVRQVLLQKLGGPAPSTFPPECTEAPALPAVQDPQPTPASCEPSVVQQRQPCRTFSGVLQPSKELEEMLTDPKQPIELLCAAMELNTNPSLFNEVLRFFRRDGFPYLDSFHPSDDKVEKAVKTIAQKRLLFERYENHWPIRFLIKRINRKQSSTSAGSPTHWIRPPLETPTQQQPVKPSGPPRIVYDCPWHAGPDISRVASSIQLLLHHRGLSEFTPIFAYLGLRTDTEFTVFCSFSPARKAALVENVRKELGRTVRLNAFQSMALELEFTPGGQ